MAYFILTLTIIILGFLLYKAVMQPSEDLQEAIHFATDHLMNSLDISIQLSVKNAMETYSPSSNLQVSIENLDSKLEEQAMFLENLPKQVKEALKDNVSTSKDLPQSIAKAVEDLMSEEAIIQRVRDWNYTVTKND